jgi:hypothetical protein
MKMILMNHLEGKAYTHLISNPEFYEMSYTDFETAFGKDFKPDLASAIPALAACKQLPKEAVRDFANRIRLAIRPMFPTRPPKIRVMDLGLSTQQVMLNPVASEEELAYQYAAAKCELMMSSYFMQGLRPDILFSMNKEDYHTFDEHVVAAEKAERFALNAGMAGRMMNSLTVSEPAGAVGGAQVNYMGGQQQLRDLQNRNGGASKGFSLAKVRCWNCNNTGHYKRDCMQREKQGYAGKGSQGFQGTQGYQGSGERDQRRGRSTERRNSDRNRSSSSVRRAAINALGKEGYKFRPGSKSRTNSRSRNNSRSRAGSRPRQSSRDGRTKVINAYLTKNDW